MANEEHIYDRLAREQQGKAQRFIVRVLLPLCAVLAVYWLVTEGPSRKPVAILALTAAAVLALLVERVKKRRQGR